MKKYRELLKTFGLVICMYFQTISTSEVYAQNVPISDPAFVTWLNANGYASCVTGNLLDTTCNLVMNATSLNCKNSGIVNLDGIQYFDSLDTLICESNPLTNLTALPNSLRLLSCHSCSLQTLPALPNLLNSLNCSSNQLSILPNLPDSLKILNCSNNQLTILSPLNDSLVNLDCSSNSLISLPVLPDSLDFLYCSSNQITLLPSLPAGLKHLYCSYNLLTSLPSLPYYSLLKLYFDHNQISSIPSPVPKWLTHLVGDYNQLSSLPALTVNNSLNTISVSHNLLTSLPSLQFTGAYSVNISHNLLTSISNPLHDFYYFNCSYNQLTILPFVRILYTGQLICNNNQLTTLGNPYLANSGGIHINCSYNQLTNLPPLGNKVTQLICNNNNLISLPDLPNSMNLLMVNNNSNLSCLPKLTTISQLQFQNTNIQCIPNYGTVGLSIPALSSVPICDIYNNNGCNFWWNINGTVYVDSNSNCLNELQEVRATNLKIQLFKNGILEQQVFTGGEGLYSFDTDTGNYVCTVDTIGLPVTVTCPSSGFQTSVISLIDSTDYDVNFGLQCKPGFDVGILSIVCDSGFFRPGGMAKVSFKGGDMSNYYGLNCANGVGGSVKIVYSGPITYIGPATGSISPILIGDTLLFVCANFGIINFQQAFKSIFKTDTMAQSGQQICFTIFVEPIAGDINPVNNNFLECFSVTSSFDPNFKTVYPSDSILNTQEWLTYTIHFQNTGNATAEHIYILDTLDVSLDKSTLTLLTYSHPIMVQIMNNVVRFNFPYIHLPDSGSNEPLSHGYVQYKIKIIDSLVAGTMIKNTANIVFDFNPPIATNTVNNIITECNQMIIADFTVPDTICFNSMLTITAEIAFTAQLEWYVDTVFAGSGLTLWVNSLNPGPHSIHLVVTKGFCSQNIQHFTYVHEPDKPSLALVGDTIYCSPAITYQWMFNTNIIAGATQSYVVSNAPGIFSVLITDSTGCSVISDSVTTGCNHIANPNVSPYSICQNDSISLNVNPYTNTTWTWLLDSVSISSAASFYLDSLVPGIHTLELVAAHPYCPLSVILSQTITVFQLPNQPIVTVFSDTLISNVHSVNQWFYNGVIIPGSTQDTIIAQQVGWYYTMITDSNGCNAISDSIYLNLVSLNELSNTTLLIIPNLFDETLLITTNTSYERIIIFDVSGRKIVDNSFSGTSISIPTSHWKAGIYFLQMFTPGNNFIRKLVKFEK